MIYLSDNRPHVYQWDTDVELTVAEGCTQVHFANSLYGRSTDVEVVDGKVFIPDKFLQSSRDIFVWGWVGVAGKGKTLVNAKIKVVARNKPADYMFTPEDQTDLKIIEDRLTALEATVSEEHINQLAINAINDYLATNPIEQVQTDWLENNSEKVQYINNRPCYTYVEVETFLPKITLVDASGKGIFDYGNVITGIINGETYTVSYNGVDYTCTAYNLYSNPDETGDVTVCLGSIDNEYPFTVLPSVGKILSNDGATEITISIEKRREVIAPLDNKYLDLDWLPINRVLKTWLASESKYNFELQGEDYVETTEIQPLVELAEGGNYFVVWDGVNYECDCYNIIGSDGTVWNCLGNSANMRAFETLHPTDDPFLVRFTKLSDNRSLFVMETDSTELTHKVGVYKGEKLLNKMPTELMPELDNVIIKSSTEGSSKKFKLTVDDNGTIKATEV